MLSLSPRFDQFKFSFPQEFVPPHIRDKYDKILARTPGVITKAIDYLNESVQGVTIPGISDLVVQQQQMSYNPITPSRKPVDQGMGRINLGRLNTESAHDNTYYYADNPLAKIEKSFTVTLRQNQSLYNYWMLYETIFERICKHTDYRDGMDVFRIDILNDDSEVVSYIELFQLYVESLDGLSFSFSKLERSSDTFDVKFQFNNINFSIVED